MFFLYNLIILGILSGNNRISGMKYPQQALACLAEVGLNLKNKYLNREPIPDWFLRGTFSGSPTISYFFIYLYMFL